MESLYRKYRPSTFADVVGQSHVVSTLERAVLEGRTSHAYLFCGPRGTGKTTMARILAKALLCDEGAGHLPDGTCEQCQLIAAGEHPDVLEIDAASNTGVDNVRDVIIGRVSYAPVRGRYKVYIIDEVHMLTPAAFNALLKTLEEPPDHVVFVMCTTDPQKVLGTVLSRVQRFDFHSIGDEDMLNHLRFVCQQEGISYDDRSLDLIVRHARGGMRDALTHLEQLSTYCQKNITADAAKDLLGETSASALATTSAAIAARNVPALFSEVATLVDGGRDLLQFTRELAAHVRDVYVVAVTGDARCALGAVDTNAIQAEAQAYGSPDRIARVLTVLGDAASEMRTATDQRLVLEIALTRIARPEADLTLESLAERVAELERGGIVGAAQVMPQANAFAQATNPAPQAPAAQPTTGAQPAVQPEPAVQVDAPQAQFEPVAQAAPQPQQAQVAPQPQQVQDAPQPQPQEAPRPQQAPVQRPNPVQTRAPRPASPDSDMQRRWRHVVDGLLASAPSKGVLIQNATIVSDDGDELVVSLPKGSSFAVRMLARPEIRDIIDPMVQSNFGQRRVTYVEGSASAAPKPQATTSQSFAGQPPVQQPTDRQSPASQPPAQQTPEQQHPASQVPAQRVSAPQTPERQVSAPQAPAPHTAALQAASSQPAPSYPMPWDDPVNDGYVPMEAPTAAEVVPPEPEVVPYDDADAYYGQEDEPFSPEPAPRVMPEQVAAPGPAFRDAPTQAPAQSPIQAPPQAPAPTPASAPAPEPAPAPSPQPQDEVRSAYPEELAAIAAMLADAFGPGVNITVDPPKPQEPEATPEDTYIADDAPDQEFIDNPDDQYDTDDEED